MASKQLSQYFLRPVVIVLVCTGLLGSTLWVPSEAQVTTNITSTAGVGNLGTIVTPGGATTTITGGTRPGNGTNLFHSFGQFTIGTGDTANFFNETHLSTTNILSRVTGGNPSNIFGTIQTTGFPGANLFLINPAGVVFGPTAQLHVEGSFHVSTADYLRLTDGVRFTAAPDAAKDALLSTAPVAAFGFLSTSPASVSVQGSTLQVPTGQTLSIIAGDINITSADATDATPGAVLRAAHGQINLVSVAAPGEVIPNQPGSPPALDASSFATLGTITESNSSNITVSNALGSGTVVVRGGRLTVDNAAINANSTGNVDGAPVGIDIRLTDDLVVSNGGLLQAFTNLAGRAGNIQIVAGNHETNTGSVQLTSNGQIFAGTSGIGKGPDILVDTGSLMALSGGGIFSGTQGPSSSGRGGDITVTAGSVLLSAASDPSNFSGIETYVSSGATGRGGDLTLTTNSLQILEGALITTPTFARGPGGNLTVHASDIFISGSSDPTIFTGIFANTFGTGKAGSLNVTAQSIELTHRGAIESTTLGPGDAGNVTITTGSLDIRDISFISTSAYFGSGNAGNLDVTADSIVITGTNSATSFTTDFTGLFSGTGPSGKTGGNIHVVARTLEVTDKGSIDSGTKGSGNAGNITLDIIESLIIERGGTVHTSTLASGHGGNVTITAPTVTVSGVGQFGGLQDSGRAGIVSQTGFGGGDAGNVVITTGSLQVLDGATIGTDSFGAGKGGNISLSADNVLISGINLGFKQNLLDAGATPQSADLNARAGIRTSSSGTGNAGNIDITAADRFQMRDSVVTTQATQADGGNITIRAGELVQLINSGITTSVGQGLGNGGNITIDPQFVILQNGSQIRANAFGGNGGNIDITAGLLLVSPDSVINASSALGVSGTITINSAISDLSGSLTPLPQGFLRKGLLLSSRCAARVGGSNSSFVVAGREAIPMEPGGLLPSPLPESGGLAIAESGSGVLSAIGMSATLEAGLEQECGS